MYRMLRAKLRYFEMLLLFINLSSFHSK